MKHLLQEGDEDKINYLFEATKSALEILAVAYTRKYLRYAVIKNYLSTFRYVPYSEDSATGMLLDPDAPSNMAIVVLQTLRTYHIKVDICDEPAFADDRCTLAIVSPRPAAQNTQVKDSLERGLWLFNQPDQYKVIQKRGQVECFVNLIRKTNSQEPEYQTNVRKRHTDLAAKCAALILSLAILVAGTFNGFLYYPLALWLPLLCIYGGGIVIMYHLYQVDKQDYYSSKLLEKACTDRSKGRNCKAVITSDAAKFLGVVSMTDIGIVYFGSAFLFLLTMLVQHNLTEGLGLLFWMAVIPIPFTFYSLYYQFIVLREICILCMATVGLLWLHLGVMLLSLEKIAISDYPSMLHLLQGGVITMVFSFIYWLYEQYRTSSERYETTILEQGKFLSDIAVFREVLSYGRPLAPYNSVPTVALGNLEADQQIVMVLSLTCIPCAKKWKEALQMEEYYSLSIGISIILAISDEHAPLQKELTQLQLKNESQKAKQLLNAWYDHLIEKQPNSPEKWNALFPGWRDTYLSDSHSQETEAAFQDQVQWALKNPVMSKPAVLYRGKVIPVSFADYDVLVELLDQLLEETA